MVLNNFLNMSKTRRLVGGDLWTNSYADLVVTTPYPVFDTNGNEISTYSLYNNWDGENKEPFSYFNGLATSYGKSNYSNLVLGTGNTEVKATDYCLENIITSNISKVNSAWYSNAYTDVENEKCIRCMTATCWVKNTGSSDLTVSEVGILSPLIPSSSTSGVYISILIYREVLDTPVIIPAGGVKAFSVSIETVTKMA